MGDDRSDDFGGSLADQLKGLDLQARDAPHERDPPEEGDGADAPEAAPGDDAPPEQEPPPLSDEELFARAVEKIPPGANPRTRQAKTRRRGRPRKKKEPRAQPERGDSPFAGALADQLAELDVEPTEPALGRARPAPGPPPPRASEDEVAPSTDARIALSDEELFEEALQGMGSSDVYAGKFHGSVRGVPRASKRYDAPPAPGARPTDDDDTHRRPSSPEDEERARARIDELREEAMFAHAVGPVDELAGSSKYYIPERDPERDAERVANRQDDDPAANPEGMITPSLPTHGKGLNHIPALEDSQKGLLNRGRLWGRRHDIRELNVRGDSAEDALRLLELFVHQRWKEGDRYVRIIHGRGAGSPGGEPVLKPAVLEWLEGPGFRYVRGYAPELTHDRDYGSLLVCLTCKD